MKKLLTTAILTLAFCVNVASQDVYIPNSFTPNGDGRNDFFIPVFDDSLKVQYYNLKIYDKFGVQVFQSNNQNDGWYGLPFDTIYIYKFYMKCRGFDEAIIETGSVTLIH